MRKLIYYVAASLDGFIAHADGSFGGFPHDEAFLAELLDEYPETFPAPLRPPGATREQNRHFDAVLMGRATYEVGSSQGLRSPYPTLDQYLVSSTLAESPDPAVQLISGDLAARVRALKSEPGKAIWLCGGGILAGQLLAAGLLDGLVVKLNPVLFGSGIPLFSLRPGALPGTSRAGAPQPGSHWPAALELVGHRVHASGHAVLRYELAPSSSSPPG